MSALIRKLRDRYDGPSGIRPDKDTDPDVLALCDEHERIEALLVAYGQAWIADREAAWSSPEGEQASTSLTEECIRRATRVLPEDLTNPK